MDMVCTIAIGQLIKGEDEFCSYFAVEPVIDKNAPLFDESDNHTNTKSVWYKSWFSFEKSMDGLIELFEGEYGLNENFTCGDTSITVISRHHIELVDEAYKRGVVDDSLDEFNKGALSWLHHWMHKTYSDCSIPVYMVYRLHS
jgi:hypothetical protein